MSSTATPAEAAAVDLHAELGQARQALSALKFELACGLAMPIFHAARDGRDWTVAAEAALLMARARGNQRLGEDALRWAHEAMQAAEVAERDDLVCAAWVAVAREHAWREEGGQALGAVDEVMSRVDRLHSAEALESAYNGLTAVYSDLGLTTLSVAFGRHAVDHALAAGDPVRVSLSRTNFLIIGTQACKKLVEPDPYEARRLLDELWPHLDQLRLEVPPIGSMLAEARLTWVTGSLLSCEGRWDEACTVLRKLSALAGTLPRPLACEVLIDLGLAQRHLGLGEEAMASGREAEVLNPVPEAPRRAVDLRRLSLICDLTGRTQEALELLRRYQDRRHHIVMSALQSRAEALSARLDEQTLRVENRTLRQRNASLQASVEIVRQMASTDPLTGLLNRRGFDAVWQLWAGSTRRRVLVLIDLDHFKRVNDEHSHAVGDSVLRMVAKMMLQTLRGHDHLARYGGEEFAALLLDVDLEQARAAVDRLREVVQQHDWASMVSGVPVTLSAGVVPVLAGETLESAAARADRLLYAAKDAGRNRVFGP